jgi:exodeoxyribonuclease-3
LRIDHLLLSPDLAPRLKAANVDRWVRDLPKASDHAPTWIELGPAPRRPVAKKAKKAPARKKKAPAKRRVAR